ncbi:lysophospholipase [Truncatella angustata]|uniref:Lysophospholipase n=1 Tax=Truncatella angustata TaxID=152316 RepID=A0A9P8RGZ7_9PEZI|nr:lysophospholipase [Truncatella angustata]KAH6645849.1 lysophospholipase [Truncatella angustata]
MRFIMCCTFALTASEAVFLASASSNLEHRAQANAPSGYAPAPVSCPAIRPTIRPATGLSAQEISWLKLRQNNTLSALETVLSRANITGLDITDYFGKIASQNGTIPRIGIAVSGGGYRALMNGAGAIAAFDNRTTNSTSPGQLGGLLQAATYLSGLSGGSWVVGSLFIQNFTSVESIISATGGFLSTLWQFNNTIIEGPDTLSLSQYYRQLYQDVTDKADAGYNTTITDYWGRALSYQLVNASDGGPGTVPMLLKPWVILILKPSAAYTFSSIADDKEFLEAKTPMPIIVAIERPSGVLQIWENSTIFEFNPWEMGSYGIGNPAFAPLKYVGSNFSNGVLPARETCVAGYDNAGFIMGTSSSLFNQAFLQIQRAPDVPDFLLRSINQTLANIGQENRDVASWPNPFYGYNIGSNMNSNFTTLTLVDGGENLQNVPLDPLLLSYRNVDIIFAIDGSADTTTFWPNGTALVATYQGSDSGSTDNNSPFPPVPDQNTFVNLGLNRHPTFFGCNTSNSTATSPLIVYIPNAPYSYNSNASTFDLEYTVEERDGIIQNGYNVATMGNSTVDHEWPACIGCAILMRSFAQTNTQFPSTCIGCFARYCWNGTTNSTAPTTYTPAQIITPSSSGGQLLHMPHFAFATFFTYTLLFLVI